MRPPTDATPDPFHGERARRAGAADWSGFGLGRGHGRGVVDDGFAVRADPAGVRAWCARHGWSAVDTPPPVVAELLGSAPVPLGHEHVATGVRTGPADTWTALALDVQARTAHGVVPTWAVTAVGRPGVGDPWRLHPRRLQRFAVGPALPALDVPGPLGERWSAAGSPALAALLAVPAVEQALLGTDDGDEVWATPTALAALRADGHRPDLVEHHLRLLTTLAGAEATLP